MATEIITLPGHLRVLFDKIYEGEAVSGNAWVVWQRVLQARLQDPAFFRRLSAVQSACRSLRQEVAGLTAGAGSITERTKNTWVGAIDQLTSLTLPSDFHLAIPQWREKARQSDITLLDTMHIFYNLHKMFTEFDAEQANSLASELGALSDTMKKSNLDGRARAFFVGVLDELRFSLANLEIFGLDGAWAEGASLIGGVLRFRSELEADPGLPQNTAAAAWRLLHFLAGTGSAGEAAARIADAVALLTSGARQ